MSNGNEEWFDESAARSARIGEATAGPRDSPGPHQGHDDNGTWYNVTLSRTYRDGEEWKSSTSFGRDELLTVAKVADLANSWIHGQAQAPANNGDGGEQQQEEEIPY